jgi:O-antigen ligase/polysaccharide polymerase Wzy-like membrane protein
MRRNMRMTGTFPALGSQHRHSHFMPALFGTFTLILLAGYAFLGRGFAYLGIPPIFVGEIGLALAFATILTSFGRIKHTLWRCAVTWQLVLFMVWCAFRTIPFLDEYRVDALRDGATWGYAVYAFAVALAVLQLDAVERLMVWYGRIAMIFLVVAPILLLISLFAWAQIPHWPWGPQGGVPILDERAGNLAVHYAGTFSFITLGLSRSAVNAWWILIWALGATAPMALSRGALVAISVVVSLTAVLRPAFKYYIALCFIASCIGVLYLSGANIIVPRGGGLNVREIGVDQLVADVESIVGAEPSTTSDLYSNKVWRERWWAKIVDYTIYGDYFWMGKGFGVNLAIDDGIVTNSDLRSPHNIHMLVLARAGVPGLIMWISLQASFAIKLFFTSLRDLRNGRRRLATIEIWVVLYWAAFVIYGTFDVFLESPQAGIWFWSIFGFGLALIVLPRSKRIAISQAFARGGQNQTETIAGSKRGP